MPPPALKQVPVVSGRLLRLSPLHIHRRIYPDRAAWLLPHPFVPEQRSLKAITSTDPCCYTHQFQNLLVLLSKCCMNCIHKGSCCLSSTWVIHSFPTTFVKARLVPSIHLDALLFPSWWISLEHCWYNLKPLLFKKTKTSTIITCPVGSALCILLFFYRALSSVCLQIGHQCLPFT